MKFHRPKITLYTYDRPGERLADKELDRLAGELRDVAASCFREVPRYQALTGSREQLRHCAIVLARDADGTCVGFASGVLLTIAGVGPVLHTGLTCVLPAARRGGLTHRLNSSLAIGQVIKRPFSCTWVTFCAAVLSSLGNVALNFDDVYPSPLARQGPSPQHLQIVRSIAAQHRDWLHLRADATFDERRFVFVGGNRGNVFQKRREDAQFHHRNPLLNDYYGSLMDFDNGDVVLQVAKASLVTAVRRMLQADRLRLAKLQLLKGAPGLLSALESGKTNQDCAFASPRDVPGGLR